MIESRIRFIHCPIVLFSLTVGLAGAVSANEHSAGKQLHAENCSHCHSDAVYQRDKTIVKNYPGLLKQVNNCQLSLDLRWSEQDIEQVARYLNSNYYQFKPE